METFYLLAIGLYRKCALYECNIIKVPKKVIERVNFIFYLNFQFEFKVFYCHDCCTFNIGKHRYTINLFCVIVFNNSQIKLNNKIKVMV